tara:strand:- start:8688 stop:8885 length:198 start_codon:yes stop_codon:yes gene_type:complete
VPKYLYTNYDKEVRDFKKSAAKLRRLRNKKGTVAYKSAVKTFKKDAKQLRTASGKLKNYKRRFKK